MSIKTQIRYLADLQALELEIIKIKQLLDKIPEELDVLAKQRNEFEKTIDQAKETIETRQKQYRSGESDSQSIDARIEKEETKLRAVKNNKEYQALLAEIEHLKTDQTTVEDQMLASLEEIEAAETQLAADGDAFKRFEVRLARQREVIGQKSDQAQKQLDEKEDTCAQLEKDIDPKHLERFRHVQSTKSGGIAIAPVHNAVCKGCHMNIPPQLYNELQRFEKLSICPKCQRMIYWEDEPSKDEDAQEKGASASKA